MGWLLVWIYDGCGSRLVPGFQGLVWLAEDGYATVCGVCFGGLNLVVAACVISI